MNEKYNIHDIFSSCPIFRELDTADYDIVQKSVQWKPFNEGQFLFKEGEQYNGFFLICDGEVEIVKESNHQGSESLAVLGQGQIFGEIALFLPEGKRVASARGKKPGMCCFFPVHTFNQLLAQENKTAYKIVLAMARTLSTRLNHMNQELMLLVENKNKTNHNANPDLLKFKNQLLASWSF